MHRIAHPDGEVGTSRAAAAMGVPMGLSAYATDPLEDVIKAGRGNPYFMQVNFLMNKDIMIDMLTRAESKEPPLTRFVVRKLMKV